MEGDFIAQFYAISGETVYERRRQFFKILNQHSKSLEADPERLETICIELQPRTALEKVFQIDFLIHFKRTPELLQQISEANEIAISKLTNVKWFYEELFQNLSVTEFVQFLPKLSYSMRMKILKKLPLDEPKYDELFDQVRQRYGMYSAITIIHRCTVSKIRQIIAEYSPELTQRQLRIIFDKEPELIDSYIEAREKFLNSRDFLNYNRILVYIAQKNPDYFFKLYKKYKFKANIGGRTTKKLIETNRKEILAKPKVFVKMLKDTRLIRKLRLDFKPFFKAIFPKNLSYSTQESFLSVLLGYARNGRFNLFKTTFNEFSFKEFGQDPEMITQNVLRLITDADEREKLAKIYLDKHEEEEHYVKYFKAENCLNIIKAKLNLASSSKMRNRYVEIMAQCCVLNEDLDSLLDLAKLMNSRFKNDDQKIMQTYLNSVILDSSKRFRATFSKELWEQLYSSILTDMKECYNFKRNCYILYYLKYLLKNDEGIDDVVARHFRCDIDDIVFCKSDLFDTKVYYKVLQSLTRACQSFNDDDKLMRHTSLAYSIQYHNRHNKEKYRIKIYECPEIMTSIKTILEEKPGIFGNHNFILAIQYLIVNGDEGYRHHKDFNFIEKHFFEYFETLGGRDVLISLLKYHPIRVQKYFNDIFNNFHSNWEFMKKRPRKCWRYMRYLSHLNLDQKMVTVCTEKLNTPTFRHKDKLIYPLSYLMPSEDFLKLAESYKPTKANLDIFNDEEKQLYEVQIQFGQHLTNIQSPRKVLDLISNYIQGDYLKTSIGSVYSSLSKIPEVETRHFIQKLGEIKAVAVKKHSILLTCLLLDQASAEKQLIASSVPTLRRALLYFQKNPSQELWRFIESEMRRLDRKDSYLFEAITTVLPPLLFKDRYNEVLWEVLCEKNKIKMRSILLERLSTENLEFCTKVMKDGFLDWPNMDTFAINCLLLKNKQTSLVLDCLRTIKSQWGVINKKSLKYRKNLKQFINAFFEAYLKQDETDVDLITEFLNQFTGIFEADEAYEETVLLELMAVKDYDVEKMAKLCLHLFRKFVVNYNLFILHPLSAILKAKLDIFKECNVYELCHYMLQLRETVEDNYIIIALLPCQDVHDAKRRKFYDEVIDELLKIDNNYVKLLLNMHLSQEL